MRKVEVEHKRFTIIVQGKEYEADAQFTLIDELTQEKMGIAWMACYEDGNVKGMAVHEPYVLLDYETPTTLDEFMGMPAKYSDPLGQSNQHQDTREVG